MARKTAFVVQPFALHRKRLRLARQEPASTESGALKKPENLAMRILGASVLKVVADDETGEREGVTILGQWGRIAMRIPAKPPASVRDRRDHHTEIDAQKSGVVRAGAEDQYLSAARCKLTKCNKQVHNAQFYKGA